MPFRAVFLFLARDAPEQFVEDGNKQGSAGSRQTLVLSVATFHYFIS